MITAHNTYLGIRVNTRDKIFCHVNSTSTYVPSSSGRYVGYVRARAFFRAQNYRLSWRKRLHGCSTMIRLPVIKDISGKLFALPRRQSVTRLVAERLSYRCLALFCRDKKKRKKRRKIIIIKTISFKTTFGRSIRVCAPTVFTV